MWVAVGSGSPEPAAQPLTERDWADACRRKAVEGDVYTSPTERAPEKSSFSQGIFKVAVWLFGYNGQNLIH